MCGIIGYSGAKNAVPILTDGLYALEYRGYDSCGMSVFKDEKTVETIKTKGRISELEKLTTSMNIRSGCGIAHTRWATHGIPSYENSHPHSSRSLSLVHNGIIDNYKEIKSKLIAEGYAFCSDTDTEVIAHLIDSLYTAGKSALDSLIEASHSLVGSYAIAVIFKDQPGVIYGMRMNSPMICAVAPDGSFLASDIPAFIKETRDYYRMDNGELVVLNGKDVTFYKGDGTPVKKELHHADFTVEQAQKGGFPHFMLKEIHEEPSVTQKTVERLTRGGLPFFDIEGLGERLRQSEHIYLIGCGTAMHAALIAKYLLEKLAKVRASVCIASEFMYTSPIIGENDTAVFISQSGETADTLAALRYAKKFGAYIFSVVNVVASSVARESDAVIYTAAGPEIAVASTKAYISQLSALYLFAFYAALERGYITEETAREYTKYLTEETPKEIEKAIAMKESVSDISKKYCRAPNMFYIGRAMDKFLCDEAALKLKEISYIECEAYAAGELKHGTISLIEPGTLVIALAGYAPLFEKLVSNVVEVKSRGGDVIGVTAAAQSEALATKVDAIIPLPDAHPLLLPSLEVLPMQLFAYYVALQRGCDIDKPRNLAKSVTVE